MRHGPTGEGIRGECYSENHKQSTLWRRCLGGQLGYVDRHQESTFVTMKKPLLKSGLWFECEGFHVFENLVPI